MDMMLKEALRAKGITQAQLGEKLGRRQGTVGDWISRRKPIPDELVPQLAELLGVDPWELLIWQGRLPRELEGIPPGRVARALRKLTQ